MNPVNQLDGHPPTQDSGRKPKVFIASPLFNPQQISVISEIEDMLKTMGYEFYSARAHSGSHRLTQEQKKRWDSWVPVYRSNIDGLDTCNIMIAVLDYPMPPDQRLQLVREEPSLDLDPTPVRTVLMDGLVLPDAGTVFEIGYYAALKKPVVGFYPDDQSAHLNLMLSHGCTGIIKGYDALGRFLAGKKCASEYYLVRNSNLLRSLCLDSPMAWTISQFNWAPCEVWDKEVE